MINRARLTIVNLTCSKCDVMYTILKKKKKLAILLRNGRLVYMCHRKLSRIIDRGGNVYSNNRRHLIRLLRRRLTIGNSSREARWAMVSRT